MKALSSSSRIFLLSAAWPAIGLAQVVAPATVKGTLIRDTTTTRPAAPVGIVLVKTPSPVIDSLVRVLDRAQIGSPEYLRAQDSLSSTFRAVIGGNVIGRFQAAGDSFEVRLQPGPGGTYTLSNVDVTPRGRLGFRTDGANRTLTTSEGQFIQYFQYPTVVDVEKDSPASRAGIRIGDSVLAFDGLDLRRTTINMTRLLSPGREVEVRLLREGGVKDVSLVVERASASLEALRRVEIEMRGGGGGGRLIPSTGRPDSADRRAIENKVVAARARATVATGGTGGVAGAYGMAPTTGRATFVTSIGLMGAAMQDVNEDLAESLNGMKGRRGVFVSNVPPTSIADRTGLKSGDVILRVDDNDIAGLGHLRVRMMMAESNGREKIRLTILRAGKTQEIVYTTR